jgi:RimJ/RimL family protein N-acetyltransferase
MSTTGGLTSRRSPGYWTRIRLWNERRDVILARESDQFIGLIGRNSCWAKEATGVEDTSNIRLPLFVDGLIVRRIFGDDFPDLMAYWSDPEVSLYQFWGPHSAEQVAAMIDGQLGVMPGDPGVALVLAVEQESTVIGDCQITITSVDDRQGEIGFAFNPRYTGRGLATRAVAAVMGFGFMQLGLHRIVAGMDIRNDRSWRLAERVGMRREAHFRHDNVVRGEWMDSFVYAILDDEWRGRYPELVAAVAPIAQVDPGY